MHISIQLVTYSVGLVRLCQPYIKDANDCCRNQHSDAALPDRFRDVDHLEEVMTAPSAALVADLAKVTGDLIILGVGGKIGPTLARLAKRAAQESAWSASRVSARRGFASN